MKKIALLIPVMLLSQIVHVNAMRNFRRSARKMHHRRGRQRKRRMFNKVQKRKQQKTLSKKRKRQEVINFDVAKNQKRSATFPSLTSSAAFSFGKYSLLSKILFFYAIILSSKQVVGRVCQGECEARRQRCQSRCIECDEKYTFGPVRSLFDPIGGRVLYTSLATDSWQCRECDYCSNEFPQFKTLISRHRHPRPSREPRNPWEMDPRFYPRPPREPRNPEYVPM